MKKCNKMTASSTGPLKVGLKPGRDEPKGGKEPGPVREKSKGKRK